MGINDKINNAAAEHLGAAKEGAGKLTGDQSLEREGQHDQAQAKLQQAGEKVKDAAADIGDNIKDAAQKLKEGFTRK
ncbi:CsbD family protein [Paenarthrobacter nitroguajacolicus]|uniref:CsbD family protein n=1 Tax=Paenarthrobacter nitroguajacolicus TaxID=211146 RepID=A0A558GTG1_PAENT|nr:CsbD family protein [Paenarthrobacter nitroguajacolicus]TVU60170.1 CsbD family protein [Paenarthrobacter nitroguajacolicus]